MKGKYSQTAYLTRLALLLAIVFIMTFFNIGNLPVGPVVATIYQVPVIIGAVMLGTGAGCFLGAAWGIIGFSLALAGQTTDVVALYIVQHSPLSYFLIAFVPRVLTGLFAGLVFAGTDRLLRRSRSAAAFAISGAVGSLTNTFFYLGALYVLAKNMVAAALTVDAGAIIGIIMGIVSTNGLLEAAISALTVLAVCKAVSVAEGKRRVNS